MDRPRYPRRGLPARAPRRRRGNGVRPPRLIDNLGIQPAQQVQVRPDYRQHPLYLDLLVPPERYPLAPYDPRTSFVDRIAFGVGANLRRYWPVYGALYATGAYLTETDPLGLLPRLTYAYGHLGTRVAQATTQRALDTVSNMALGPIAGPLVGAVIQTIGDQVTEHIAAGQALVLDQAHQYRARTPGVQHLEEPPFIDDQMEGLPVNRQHNVPALPGPGTDAYQGAFNTSLYVYDPSRHPIP